ncbi:hypothetical protein [Xanthomonas translucens]|uniref:Uncharacterized protein n=4 Tax=Xanthomonas campestris pv. translucens TaxID=343 RepID=A0A109HP06_XANCT|nr:hypothetical protein [Xanthomonas translucens]KTF38797.1 hypothetical protein OZ12_14280 [Xanthomonas translucens pv. translucens]KWV11944.1 hypothetical protein ATB53_18505 [Xanthomonas translucens]KWV15734.1 hypothetical protein ATB54_09710 [Xanthomonas translucens]MCC8447062.1 hypothetical protein [Xanthomonas translucens pv. translucens]MCS3361483.1 hypothetical protein [Xanthomonas translucens pv. translucens]
MPAIAPDAIVVEAFYALLELDGITRMHDADSQALVAQIDVPVAHSRNPSQILPLDAAHCGSDVGGNGDGRPRAIRNRPHIAPSALAVIPCRSNFSRDERSGRPSGCRYCLG